MSTSLDSTAKNIPLPKEGVLHTHISTGWRRLLGTPKLQIIFHKRATKYRSLLRKMTYNDMGSYESSPPCNVESTSSVSQIEFGTKEGRIHFLQNTFCTHTPAMWEALRASSKPKLFCFGTHDNFTSDSECQKAFSKLETPKEQVIRVCVCVCVCVRVSMYVYICKCI